MKIVGINPMQGMMRPMDASTVSRRKAVEQNVNAYQASSEALEKSAARTAYRATPDVREDRVTALRAQIEAGTYEISPWDIASRIVDARI
ncbi:MAG: flagellar biosynthesis anti-sigma factor FlgM [Defluviitaleaceae bacterium]|nr:flagellar biosynthesis anti-sigma factor FlgM [Defluviitaleaceae bacterium]